MSNRTVMRQTRLLPAAGAAFLRVAVANMEIFVIYYDTVA